MAETDQIARTRTEKRRLAKEKKQAARKQAVRKKAVRRWSLRIMAVVLPLILVYLFFFHKPDVSHKGLLRIPKPEHNLGVISVAQGVKETEIPMVNIGEGPLTITGLDSSCGCTTASVVNNGSEGPRFQMESSGKNPKNWRTVIRAGEQALLKVYYDPTVHPKLKGSVTRIVTVYSDDPIDPKQEVRIKVFQIG